MVDHEDIRVEKESVAALANSKDQEIFLIILGIFEYLLAIVDAGKGVMECVLIFAWFAGRNPRSVNRQDDVIILISDV
jgi:hypothetical protein